MQRALEGAMSHNFVPQIHGGCVAEQAGGTQGINDLLMASDDGVVEIFPAGALSPLPSASPLPSGSATAICSFATLRARGAFLVSASIAASATAAKAAGGKVGGVGAQAGGVGVQA